jgi:transcription initiation factor TFIID subunit 6
MSLSVHPQARPLLVSLVEEHVTNVVRQAVQVNRHCKRARQHEDDAAAFSSSETGNNGGRARIRRRLHAADVNMALQLMNAEQLYATNVVFPNNNKAKSDANNHQRVQLKEFLQYETERMPMGPSEVGIRMHWLAVDGKQPLIPQNPWTTATSSNNNETAMIASVPAGLAPTPNETQSLNETSSTTTGPVQVQRLQSSLLSEELLLYYIRLTTSMERGGATAADRQEQDVILASLSQDSGLQELVPFVVRYAQQEIYRHLKHQMDHCRTLIRLISALLLNKQLHLELHLHELLPALMTCVVTKHADPTTDHWVLRREAATVLIHVCQLYAQDYVTLKARVLKALVEAATPTNESLASRYGGMIAISLFGAKAIDAFLLPTLLQSWRDWEVAMQEHLDLSMDIKFAIQMCQRAALDALGIYLASVVHMEDENVVERLNWLELEYTLGDQCVPIQGLSTEYATCFI